ncbi:UV excision repair protein Rad23 [Acaromyces ingoldii]|uniref:UV excision repair protein RAD23 n=1 Tax=Acaromyces ingoldii TaxID=215250 RepID=A0A316YJ40_9BASI|nr:UV excision repair protein Rad23 [Acaromyces ingoldii]PWN88638.1 UV excision repair protein Rad23 [Acaromyces ingoldii]
MKLTFKSLQGSNFSLDAEPTDTIGSVKSKIESVHGHAASAQKIIFSGKILTDNDTVASCGVKEKDFLVLMVSKPKAPKAAAPATTEASTSSTSITSADQPASNTPAATTTTSTPSTTDSAPAAVSAPAPVAAPGGAPTTGGGGSFLTGAELEAAVNNMVEMGFEKEQVQKAMRASFNNPERAVEYLMTGIPEHLLLQQQQQQQQQQQPPARTPGDQAAASPAAATSGEAASGAVPAAQPASTAQTTAPTGGGGNAPARAGNLFEAAAAAAQQGGGGGGPGTGRGGGGAGGAAALRGLGEEDDSGHQVLDLGNPAMLAQLRQLVQQNPAALSPLVQALAQSNPQLANAMAEDPEGVLNLLASGAAGGLGGEEGEEAVSLPSMEELSPEDRTAVEQIIGMGIPESKAIEAYLMCGRNVEMAVQYYFENPQDFDD